MHIHRSKKNIIISIIVAVVIIAGITGYIIYQKVRPIGDPLKAIKSPTKVDAVTDFVIEFGTKISQVSLVAPQAELKTEMDAAYGPYVSQDLLAAWEQHATSAPGRLISSSSPNIRPDHIEVLSVQRVSDNIYIVNGGVIEVAATASLGSTTAGVYPINVEVTDTNGKFLITGFEKQPYIKVTPAKKK